MTSRVLATADGREVTDELGFVTLPVAALKVVPCLREEGLREPRIKALMASPASWTPIVVVRSQRTVVDGQHRMVAAKRLGLTEVRVELFEGTGDDAFVEFVRRNAPYRDGLSRRERRHAAQRVLQSHVEWSDRRIAELCGISPKTVAQLRGQLGGQVDVGTSDVRVGRDGRARPVDAAARRAEVVAALDASPAASLRAIARTVGVSPETVRSVRNQLDRSAPARPTPPVFEWRPPTPAVSWQPDQALLSREDGAHTAKFFERTDVCESDLECHVTSIPLSRVYEVADEARRRAVFWQRLAERVESQAERQVR